MDSPSLILVLSDQHWHWFEACWVFHNMKMNGVHVIGIVGDGRSVNGGQVGRMTKQMKWVRKWVRGGRKERRHGPREEQKRVRHEGECGSGDDRGVMEDWWFGGRLSQVRSSANQLVRHLGPHL